MDSNILIKTQHTLLCITSITKSKKGFNNPRQHHTVPVALNMSKAFDTVNKNKLILTNIQNTIIKFKANYI